MARLALAAALLPAALLPATADAQRPSPPPRPVAPPAPPAPPAPSSDEARRALAAELADLQRRRAAAAERLERFAATLRTREATAIVHDSLLLLVREHAELGTRASLVAARLSFRDAEREARRATEQARIEVRRQQARSSAGASSVASVAPAAPEGWFGVNVEQVPASVAADGRWLTLAEYPRVLSVEPASPAARAGLQAGDRLVAIAGNDLREHPLDLARLLRPGRTLPVRLARDGSLQEVRVVVTPKPRTFVSGVTVRVTTEGGQPVAGASDLPRVVSVTPRAVAGGAPPRPVRVAPPAMTAPSPLTLFYRSPNVALLAGAEIVHLPAELRAALADDAGERRGGVLVVQVARGSLAERAGLRGGDVLLRANGNALTSPDVLHRVARQASAGSSQVTLDLLRDRRPRTVTLRW